MRYLILLLCFIVFSSCEFKKKTVFELTDFNLNYLAPSGSSDFSLYVGVKNRPSKMNVDFEVKDSNLYTYFPGITYVSDVPTILKDTKDIRVEGFNLLLAQNSAQITLDNFLMAESETQSLSDLSVNCSSPQANDEEEVLQSIMDACIAKTDLRFYSYSNADDFEITNAKGSIRNNYIYFEGKIHSTINGKFKLEGKVDFNENDKTLSVRIDKVKFGIFSIKGKFFKELKDLESDSFKVNEPYVYYQF